MAKVRVSPGMVFERYEAKYRLTEGQYARLRALLGTHMQEDVYGRTSVGSLYFDTADWLLAGRSIQRPVYKEKLRLRSYGIPQDTRTVFLELKKKLDGVTYKRRVAMTFAEAMRYMSGGEPPDGLGQIFREIDWFVKFYRPAPALLVLYDRVALCGTADRNLRITFDSDIRFRTDRLDIPLEGGTPLVGPGERVMEVKVAQAFPHWLSRMLSELRVYPASFSKYGAAYRRLKKEESCVAD